MSIISFYLTVLSEWNTVYRELSRLREAEADPAFRLNLLRMARKGLRVGAVLGIIAVFLFVGIHALFGRIPTLSYRVQQGTIVLYDKLLIVGFCVLALAIARWVRLNDARLIVAVIIILAGIASVLDDLYSGSISFAPGYVVFIYLLGVIAVPFHPVQTAVIGTVLTLLLFVITEFLPSIVGISPPRQYIGHYVYMLVTTVLYTGVSWLFYVSRYEQFRALQEAEQLREHVEELAQVKDRFFANISHEFRTPLTLLLGPIEDALEGRYGSLTQLLRQRLEIMSVQAHRLRYHINQLLDLSRLDAGRMPLRAWQHDLVGFARHQASLFQSLAERKQIDLLLDLPSAPVYVWFDMEKMEEVLTNLLSNAFKFTPEGGRIRIRISSEERDWHRFAIISVRDSGHGIPLESISVIFDRFQCTDGLTGGQASTGIGLALVKELVERHGGQVTATSEPGFGAEITIRLPLGRDHLAGEDIAAYTPEHSHAASLSETEVGQVLVWEAPALSVENNKEANETAPLVVIVEDEPYVRAYVRDLLVPTYRIIEARDGDQALVIIRENRPDLVISDILMPGLDGIELCRAIKENDDTATIPVILLTALSEETRMDGLKAGADAYLSKPFSSAELLVLVENLIEVRRVLQERIRMPDWIQTKAPVIPSHDAEFLDRVQQVVGEHLENGNFGVDWLADEVGLSPRQLQRRLRDLTRLSAGGFIKTMRLARAAQLLIESDLQVSEVAHAVGYEDANYFARLFRQVYGVPPSEYPKLKTQ